MKFTKHTNHALYLLLLVTLLFLQGCSFHSTFFKEAHSFKNIKKGEVIIVGTIGLSPKLESEEQDLIPPGIFSTVDYSDWYGNKSVIQFNSEPETSSNKFVINPKLGRLFFFRIPRSMNYIVEGSIVTVATNHGYMAKITLPTGFKVNIRPTDKAVYIGDLHYIRDDFNSITSITFKDNYKKAQEKFRRKFGTKYKLRKSLLEKINNK